MNDEVEIIEKYIILLLGVVDNRPIPSTTHLQKELFVLSNANKRIKELIKFEKHNFGPYSDDLTDVSQNPIYHPNAYYHDNNKIYITNEGRQFFKELLENNKDNSRFNEMLIMLKMIRNLYDKLNVDELLFIIYLTYDTYTEKSIISDKLLNPPKRNQLALRVYRKGVITEKKYNEIIGEN